MSRDENNIPTEIKTNYDFNLIVDLHKPTVDYNFLNNIYLNKKVWQVNVKDNNYISYAKFYYNDGGTAMEFWGKEHLNRSDDYKTASPYVNLYTTGYDDSNTYKLQISFPTDTNQNIYFEVMDSAGNKTKTEITWFMFLGTRFSFILNDENKYANNDNYKIDFLGELPQTVQFSCDGTSYTTDYNAENTMYVNLVCPEGDLNFHVKGTFKDGNTEINNKNIYLDKQKPIFNDYGIKLTIIGTNILVEWNNATDNKGIKEYKIVRNGNVIATTDKNFYMDSMILNNDGNVVYYIQAMDLAGNKEDSNSASIYYDNKSPFITSINPEEKGEYVYNPEIKIEFQESNLDTNTDKTYLIIDGTKVSATITTGTISYITSFTDGNHSLKIRIEDTKGNITEKDWNFSKGTRELKIDSFSANAGTMTVQTKNNGSFSEKISVNFYINGTKVKETNDILVAGEIKSYNHTYSLSSGTHTLKIELLPTDYDTDTTNNTKTVTVTVSSGTSGGGGGGGGSGGGSSTTKKDTNTSINQDENIIIQEEIEEEQETIEEEVVENQEENEQELPAGGTGLFGLAGLSWESLIIGLLFLAIIAGLWWFLIWKKRKKPIKEKPKKKFAVKKK